MARSSQEESQESHVFESPQARVEDPGVADALLSLSDSLFASLFDLALDALAVRLEACGIQHGWELGVPSRAGDIAQHI